MIETLAVLVVFVALVGLAFGASVRVGMLVGRRLDRMLEARAAAMNASPKAATSANDGRED